MQLAGRTLPETKNNANYLGENVLAVTVKCHYLSDYETKVHIFLVDTYSYVPADSGRCISFAIRETVAHNLRKSTDPAECKRDLKTIFV